MSVEMTIHGMAQEPGSGNPLIVLKEKERERYLFIGVGPLEISAIATAAMGVPRPRPMTHDLLCSALEACGARITEAVIHALVDGIFHARLVLDVQGRHAELDSRSSDAIAVAMRVGIPVHAEEAVLERAGITPGTGAGDDADRPGGQERIDEEQLDAFRDAIKGLNLDDLGRPGPAS